MDDSADKHRQKVFVVAGFLGHSEDWFEAERHWEARIKRDGIDYFRMSDFVKLDGAFEKLKARGQMKARQIANELFEDLKLILKSSDLKVCALGVLMRDYKKVLSSRNGARVLQKDPYVHAHQQLIHKVATFSLEDRSQPVIAFLYDQTNKAGAIQNSWPTFKERNPIAAECMGTLAPLDDKAYSCIQMADMIANATKRMFESRIDRGLPLRNLGTADLEEMQEWSRHIGWIGYWEEGYLRAMVKGNVKFATPADSEFWIRKRKS